MAWPSCQLVIFIALRSVDLGGENRHWWRYLMSSSLDVIWYALLAVWLSVLWVLCWVIFPNCLSGSTHNPVKHYLVPVHTISSFATLIQMTSKEELIRYLHQCLFCPPKSTILKAIKNNQLATWPGLTAEAVQKIPPRLMPSDR